MWGHSRVVLNQALTIGAFTLNLAISAVSSFESLKVSKFSGNLNHSKKVVELINKYFPDKQVSIS